MFWEYIYRSRNRCRYIVIAKYNKSWWPLANTMTTPPKSIECTPYGEATTLVPPYMASIYGPMTSYFVPRLRSVNGTGNQARLRQAATSKWKVERSRRLTRSVSTSDYLKPLSHIPDRRNRRKPNKSLVKSINVHWIDAQHLVYTFHDRWCSANLLDNF